MVPSLVTCPTINVAQSRAFGELHESLRAVAHLRNAACVTFGFGQPNRLNRIDDQRPRVHALQFVEHGAQIRFGKNEHVVLIAQALPRAI